MSEHWPPSPDLAKMRAAFEAQIALAEQRIFLREEIARRDGDAEDVTRPARYR